MSDGNRMIRLGLEKVFGNRHGDMANLEPDDTKFNWKMNVGTETANVTGKHPVTRLKVWPKSRDWEVYIPFDRNGCVEGKTVVSPSNAKIKDSDITKLQNFVEDNLAVFLSYCNGDIKQGDFEDKIRESEGKRPKRR